MVIISKNNEKIKYINSLKEKKYRDKYNKYILEGIKLIDEHLSLEENKKAPELIVLSKDMLIKAQGGSKLYDKVKDMPNIIEVDDNIFRYISDTETPQGILVVLEKQNTTLDDLSKNISKGEKVILLDKIADAGNLGTIIRTAVSFGVKNVICVKGSVDVYSPKVVRSTMGAIGKINIFNLEYSDINKIKQTLKNNNYTLCGTDLKATKYLHEIKKNSKTIYVLGNEANGISNEIKDMCDEFVKIQMEDVQESLNVAIAAAILMYDGYVGGVASGS